MNLLCKMGLHSWDEKDCSWCTKCYKQKESNHTWDGCKCKKCGASRNEYHTWERCICLKCGKSNPDYKSHQWENFICSKCGESQFISAIINSLSDNEIEEFISIGVDINIQSIISKKTALHAAIEHHRIKLVEILLKHGINTEAKDWLGRTALAYALFYEHNNTKLMEMLIDYDADYNAKDGFSSFSSQSIFSTLQSFARGGELPQLNEWQRTNEWQRLINKIAVKKATDKRGITFNATEEISQNQTIHLVREFLLLRARSKEGTTYSELARMLQLNWDNEENRILIENILFIISSNEFIESRPLLSAIVIDENTKMPDKDFFLMTNELGINKTVDDFNFFLGHMYNVHEYWSKK